MNHNAKPYTYIFINLFKQNKDKMIQFYVDEL